MSCFIVPLAQAAVTGICRKHFERHPEGSVWISRLPTLEKMLWGGALVLIVDHIAHGELLTFSLRELLTVGIPMSVVVTTVWAVICLRNIYSPGGSAQRK